MKKKLIINLIALTIIFSHQVKAQSDATICDELVLNEDNIDNYTAELQEYYELNYADPYPNSDEALSQLNFFLKQEINTLGYAEQCFPGPFWYADYDIQTDNSGKDTYQMYFRWKSENVEFSHRAMVYDFLTGKVTDFGIASPNGIVVNTEEPRKKFILLHSTCLELGQSRAFGIIIDRDISFLNINSACDPYGPAVQSMPGTTPSAVPVPRKSNFNSAALRVYPSPVQYSNISLEFDLPVEQKISIQVIEANSGKIINQFFTKKTFSQGSHNFSTPSDQLGKGLYYIILQTETERIVQKLIKL